MSNNITKSSILPDIPYPCSCVCRNKFSGGGYAIGFFVGFSLYDYPKLGLLVVALLMLIDYYKSRNRLNGHKF